MRSSITLMTRALLMVCEFDWSGPVSWGLVVVGWLVINQQNNKRETRKEIRSALSALYELLHTIEDKALKYHTGNGDPLESRTLKRHLAQIYPRVGLAFQSTIDCKYSREVFAFRQAVTLRNFDTASFAALDASDPFFESISNAREQLVSKLEHAFLKHYRQ